MIDEPREVAGIPVSVRLWSIERTHPVAGYEAVELTVNTAGDLLIVVDDGDESAASTLTREDVSALRDALTAYLTEEIP